MNKPLIVAIFVFSIFSTSLQAQICNYSLNGKSIYSFKCRVITTGMQPKGIQEPISFIDNKENFDRYDVGTNYEDFKQISKNCIERRLGNGDKVTKVCYK